MIRMYPKAVVLTARHPFGGTEMMAQSLAFALNANGYDTRILNVNEPGIDALAPLLADPDLALVMTTGSLPLSLAIDGVPVWRAVRPHTRFLMYIVDAWPYDAVRVPAFRAFLGDWHGRPNLHLAGLEGNDARLIGGRTHHMPTGAYPAPWRTGDKRHPDRMMIWASAHKELAISALHDGFEDTVRDNNPWGLDDGRIRRVGEVLRHTTIVHGLSAIADAMDTPLPELARPDHLVALSAIDSCLKRYRRVKVVRALRDFPVDIYGQNWEPYVEGARSVRLLVPDPNHNHVFSYVCQHYAGLFNFDPNFADGTNERAVSALAMGIPIANNFNRVTDGLAGVHAYHFSDESIRFAAERLLAHAAPVPTPPANTWEYRVGRLLRAIAAEPVATAAPGSPAAARVPGRAVPVPA